MSSEESISNESTQLMLRLKTLKEDFKTLSDETTQKLNACHKLIEEASHIAEQAVNMSTELQTSLENLSADQKEWIKIKGKLANTALSGKVILNVGGKIFTTTVATLTEMKDSFFTALFSKQWTLEYDSTDKSIFIDRDGDMFQHIVTYMRTKKLPSDIFMDQSLREFLIIEAQYFHLHEMHYALTEPERKEDERRRRIDACFEESTLLNIDFKIKLNEFYGKQEQPWELIYKATRDGFQSARFHANCDNKGPTLTIIQANNGSLFGGYISIPWHSNAAYSNDASAFIFTLENQRDVPPTKFSVNPNNAGNAMYGNAGYGPTWGAGHDIHVATDSNINSNSDVKFPNSYSDSTGKGAAVMAGGANFMTTEIEVYKLRSA